MKDLVLKQTKKGRSVFANRDFRKGEFIIEFRGRIYSRKDMPRGFNSHDNHYLQIGKDAYLGPVKSIDDSINHSCNPNAGFRIGKKVLLFAIKNIKKGDEITFDYSTTMSDGMWKMECICSARNCRRVINDFRFLPKNVQKRYIGLGIVPDYILRNLG
jgi:SET domain-containing protein